jgi:hypothetical protein
LKPSIKFQTNKTKRKNMKTQIAKITSYSLLAASLAGLCLGISAYAGNSPAPGGSTAFGKTLNQWEDIYWRWTYGALTVPTDANGNAVVNGNVVLMALPNAPGDGTPGHLDVTLNSGQAFMMPLWGLLGNSYSDGTPDDPLVDVSVLQTLDITLQIDGVTVINAANHMQYYSEFYFDPVIPLPAAFAPYAGIIWFEGIGTVHAPFSAGTHAIKLDVKNTQPAFGFIFEYHNTWTVTVQPAP